MCGLAHPRQPISRPTPGQRERLYPIQQMDAADYLFGAYFACRAVSNSTSNAGTVVFPVVGRAGGGRFIMTTCHRSHSDVESAPDVERRAWALINNHSHFRGRAKMFDFVYRDHVLTLRGCVPSFYLKQVLQTAIRDLDGVRLIDNHVEVMPCDGLG